MADYIKPLSKAYSEDTPDEKIEGILDAVIEFCRIDEEHEALPTDKPTLWPLVWQVLRILSTIACWDDNPDDLFLLQTREQIFEANVKCGCSANCCVCDDDYVIIPLEYIPYTFGEDNPFVEGRISAMVNGKFETADITAEYLNEHLNHADGKVYILRSDFPEMLLDGSRCCCLCDKKVSIWLYYNAGYNDIPAGLLPIICALLNKVQNGIDDTDCHDNMTQTSGLLKRKKVGNVEYEWSTSDTTTSKTATLYSDIHDIAMVDEVLALSRCYLNTQKEELGDVV